MALGAILAAALTDHSAHPYAIFIDGVDVIKNPAGLFGVGYETISISEVAPPGVSSMRFTIDDPSLTLSIDPGARILAWDYTRDLPMFRGFLESVSVRPGFGGQGRLIDVSAYGDEALLDLCIVPSLVFPAVQFSGSQDGGGVMSEGRALQVIAASAPVSARSSVSSGSALATPIDSSIYRFVMDAAAGGAAVDVSGLTVRAAFDKFLQSSINFADSDPTAPPPDTTGASMYSFKVPMFLSVDLWGGLRLFAWGGGTTHASSRTPSDYATLTVVDTGVGALRAANLAYTLDTGAKTVVSAVYVQGGNAAGSGWVSGNTSAGRHEAFVSASTSTTAVSKIAAASSVLLANNIGAGRGSFDLEAYTPTNVHPGSPLVFTDASQGWVAKTFLISQIDKRPNAGGVTWEWHVSFFDPASGPSSGSPSAARLLRTIAA